MGGSGSRTERTQSLRFSSRCSASICAAVLRSRKNRGFEVNRVEKRPPQVRADCGCVDTAYRAAGGLAAGTSLLVLRALGAAGILGVRGDPADLMLLRVLGLVV